MSAYVSEITFDFLLFKSATLMNEVKKLLTLDFDLKHLTYKCSMYPKNS